MRILDLLNAADSKRLGYFRTDQCMRIGPLPIELSHVSGDGQLLRECKRRARQANGEPADVVGGIDTAMTRTARRRAAAAQSDQSDDNPMLKECLRRSAAAAKA